MYPLSSGTFFWDLRGDKKEEELPSSRYKGHCGVTRGCEYRL